MHEDGCNKAPETDDAVRQRSCDGTNQGGKDFSGVHLSVSSARAEDSAPLVAKPVRRKRGCTSATAQREVREYTLGEEIANSLSHGVGALLSIVALPILIVSALAHGGGMRLFVALVYGITMLLEYVMSTLYHALTHEGAKRVFKVLDHSFIYLFIAGTYTPFCFITLENNSGVILGIVVWILALAGVACEAFWVFRPRWISAALYLALGWCIIWFIPVLLTVLPPAGLALLLAGGISYSIGCIFYVLKKVRYMHSVFHVLVVVGSVCQFLAILLFVV